MQIPFNLKSDIELTCIELKVIDRKITKAISMERIAKWTTLLFAVAAALLSYKITEFFPRVGLDMSIGLLGCGTLSGFFWVDRKYQIDRLISESFNREDRFLKYGYRLREDGTGIVMAHESRIPTPAMDPFDPLNYSTSNNDPYHDN